MNSRNAYGKRAGIIGIAANALLFCGKIAAGVISGSLSVIADAVNNLTDALSSALVLVGYHISAKPADKEHPYGHARMEYISSLLVSVIVTFLGFEFLRESLGTLISDRSKAQFSVIAAAIMLFSIAAKAALAVYFRWAAKKINSPVIAASAKDCIGDILATSAALLGIALTPVFGSKCDAVFSLAMSVYILVMGIGLIRESADTLLGQAPDSEFVSSLSAKLKSYDGVLGIHDLVVHTYGAGKCFVSVHVEVDADDDILAAHDMIDNIENELSTGGLHLVIHMDPIQHSNPEVTALRERVWHEISHLQGTSEYFSMHDFRVVFGCTHTNIIFDLAVPEEYPMTNRELSNKVRERIKGISADYNLILTIDRGYEADRY